MKDTDVCNTMQRSESSPFIVTTILPLTSALVMHRRKSTTYCRGDVALVCNVVVAAAASVPAGTALLPASSSSQ